MGCGERISDDLGFSASPCGAAYGVAMKHLAMPELLKVQMWVNNTS